MRNSSDGASLAPLPFDTIPGLEVTELSPVEALLAAQAEARRVFHAEPAEPGAKPPRQVLVFKQCGFWDWTLALFMVILAALAAMAVSLGGERDSVDDVNSRDIETCIKLGGTPTMHDGRVRCTLGGKS